MTERKELIERLRELAEGKVLNVNYCVAVSHAADMLEADAKLHQDCMNLGLENGELQDQIKALQKSNPPLAFYDISHDEDGEIEYLFSVYPRKGFKPLYTAPQPQPTELHEPVSSDEWLANCPQSVRDLANKIKAEMAVPQEPVAFICHGHLYKWPSEDAFCGNPEDHIPLYTAPQRPRLTDAEILNIHALPCWVRTQFADKGYGIALDTTTVVDFARAVEKKVRGEG